MMWVFCCYFSQMMPCGTAVIFLISSNNRGKTFKNAPQGARQTEQIMTTLTCFFQDLHLTFTFCLPALHCTHNMLLVVLTLIYLCFNGVTACLQYFFVLHKLNIIVIYHKKHLITHGFIGKISKLDITHSFHYSQMQDQALQASKEQHMFSDFSS